MDIFYRLKNYPFLVLVCPAIVGIIAGQWFNVNVIYLFIALIIFFSLQLLLFRLTKISLSFLHGIIIGFTMFSIGWIRMEMMQSKHQYNIITDTTTTSIFTVLDYPDKRANSYRVKGELLQQDSVEKNTFPKEIMYLYFETDSQVMNLKPGKIIAASSYIQRIKNNGNPEEFDYQSYLKRRNILYQTFIKHENWEIIGYKKVFWVIAAGNQAKTYARETFKQYIDEHGIVSAMLLGERNQLDHSMKSEFSKAGIMHILAISGLHVGLILLFLNTSLFFLSGTNSLRTLRTLLVVFLLWLYAWMTGFSPSVVRATMMFSFFTLGQLTSRKANSYNILAFTAFVMLMLNPYNIFEVGFQLSFIAVLSILFFYPKIYRLMQFGYFIPDKLWQIISVSLAAQILTFPLTIFYFHQFSTWFLLANLIAIPVVFLIVLSSLTLLVISQFAFICGYIGLIINYLIHFLVSGTRFVNAMPGNLLTGLHVSNLQLITLYLCLSLFMMLLVSGKNKYLVMLFSLIIISLNINTLNTFFNSRQNELVIFNVSGLSVINILENKQATCLLSDTSNNGSVSYAMDNYLIKNNVWNTLKTEQINECTYPSLKIFENSRYFRFGNDDLLLLKDDISNWNIKTKLDLDYLIISDGAGDIDLLSLSNTFNTRNIIIDSSVPYYIIRKMFECQDVDSYHVHVVADEGAFILESTK